MGLCVSWCWCTGGYSPIAHRHCASPESLHGKVCCHSAFVHLQEFAVGVVSADGRYRLIDSGPLPEAVAASAAIPYIFEPLQIPGQPTPEASAFVMSPIGWSA